MKHYSSSPASERHPLLPTAGFSMVEVVTAIAIIAIIAGVGFVALSKYRENTERTKLENDVAAMNRAAQMFRVSGGNLSSLTRPEDIVAQLKTIEAADEAEYTVGFHGLMVDKRVTPVLMTAAEQATNRPRAVWVPSESRFKIVTAGEGIKEFALGTVTTAAESLRESSFEYARASDWIWDYSEDESSERSGYNGSVTQAEEVPTTATGTTGTTLQQLQPPVISLPGGFYANELFPLQVSLSNPNAAGQSAILFSLDGSNWNVYTGNSVVVQAASPAVTLLAFCQSQDPDNWQDSISSSEAYETFTFSGSSSGTFSTPATTSGSVYTIETTATGGSKFSWGTVAAGYTAPSSLTFEGADFENIVPEIEFVVGTLSFYNGTIYAGTEASGVELNVALEVEVNIPVENEELVFPLELINTPNYDWQSNNDNADYVKLTSTSTNFATAADGTIYYLVLGFADSTSSGFTTIDEFHVWEGQTAVGTLVARVTTVVPGQEDTTRPNVILYTSESNVNGQFEVFADFNEYVDGFEVTDLVVTNGSPTGLTGNGFKFSFFVTPANDGNIAIFVPNDIAVDLKENGNNASNSLIVTADMTSPVGVFTYSINGGADGSSGNPFRINGNPTIPLVFTEGVTGLGLDDFTVQNGTISNLSGSGSSYSFLLTPSSGGDVILTMVSGAVVDAVDNPNEASDPVYFRFDDGAPELVLASAETTVSGPFVVSGVVSESVTGFTAGDVTVVNGSVQSFTGSGANYTITVAPSNIGDVFVSVAANKMADQAGNQNLASNTVTVTYEQSAYINFDDYAILSFDNSQDDGSASVSGGGSELRIKDNAWKAINFPYTITSNTVIEFEFKSPKEGEIHGIGFDTDNSISSNRSFKVYGSQNWGYTNYDNFSGNSWKSYSIPVGQFYTGYFTKLVFIADDDFSGNGLGESRFRNVRVYNQ
ncbi:MAG: choice-of-anchor K domain-containing protein [Verrucomicrobiales bacterium]